MEHGTMGRIGHLLNASMVRIAPVVATLLAFAMWAASPGLAQPGTRGGASAPTSLETGINAYNEGAIEAAAESLSDALDQGNLSPTKTAQAYYYRGLAYRELGKPDEAIADLTKAIAAKNALSKGDLKVAARNRAGAIREAGLANTETPVRPDKQSGTHVHAPPARVPVMLGNDAAASDQWMTTSSIDAPKPAAPVPSPWGETSVRFAPAAR
jgi:tetratricopeptide (TPR) repeat protein